MRDYLDIVRRNLLSPIVIAIFLLAAALIFVREYRDAWFISVVIVVNSTIGIVQEIRAKRVLKKLELMSQPRAKKLVDGEIVEVMYDELAAGDEILVQAGDELPADGEVIESKALEVDEGMLTGESVPVEKPVGEKVWAATTAVAGEANVRVTAVGSQTKAGAISQVLKRYTPELTPLQRAIQFAITLLTYGAVGVAVLIFLSSFISGQDDVAMVLKTIVSAAVTVVPEGLLLASSLLLAFGSLRLAQARVLPQKLSAIEAMALLNLLAVDKTGTLTSDEVVLESIYKFEDGLVKPIYEHSAARVFPYDDVKNSERSRSEIGFTSPILGIVALIAEQTSGGNITGRAILDKLTPPKNAKILDTLAFSSARKMAGVQAKIDGKIHTVVMGAPEFVSELTAENSEIQAELDELTAQGLRVLALAEFPEKTTSLKKLSKKSGRIIGAVVLRNSLRPGVEKTVEFLQEQGVQIRVISGDNPRTVQFIAKAAGIDHSEKAITGAELASLTKKEFARAADENVIFARVLPEQKERLIAHFRHQKLFTGMVGDGVNDALALKKADLGVAMQAGAPASRRVADVVLLDNSFTSLPTGMRLGNRVMQAIELIAILFFHKIIYGLVLLILTMILATPYPYAPRHITFMNIFLVTMPTIMWTLFPPTPKHRINPNNFWRDTLQSALPLALITGSTVAISYFMLLWNNPGKPVEVSTVTVLVATFFGIFLVFLADKILGVKLNRKAAFARCLYILAVIVVVTLGFGVRWLRGFFDFHLPSVTIPPLMIVVILLAIISQWLLAIWLNRRIASQK